MPSFVAFRQAINCTVSTHEHPKFSCKNILLCIPESTGRKHNQIRPLVTSLCLLSVMVVRSKFMILFSPVAIKSNISESVELQKNKERERSLQSP